jgi:hypothetical protein
MPFKKQVIVGALFSLIAFKCALGSGLVCCFPQSIRYEAKGAKFILVGRLSNAKNEESGGPSTDLTITKTLKDDPCLAGKLVVQISRYFQLQPDQSPTYIVFGEPFRDRLDIYRGIPATPEVVAYVEGILAINENDSAKLLKFLIDHWNDDSKTIAEDVRLELSLFKNKTLAAAAWQIPPEPLRKHLKDPFLPFDVRTDVAAVLLGCRKDKCDVEILRAVLEQRIDRNLPVTQPLLLGYILVNPADGWAYLSKTIHDPTSTFATKCAALKVVEEIYRDKLAPINERDLNDAYSDLLQLPDFPDFVIDSLRRSRNWSQTDKIVALSEKPENDQALVRRSLVRYGIQCPNPATKVLLEKIEAKHPGIVADIKECLAY